MPSIGVFFEVESADTLPGDAVSVVGSLPELGGWAFDARRGNHLSTNAFMYPLWTTLHPVSLEYDEACGDQLTFQYKYTIFKSSTGEVKQWEDSILDRSVTVPLKEDTLFLVVDSKFNGPGAPTVSTTTMEEMKKRWASFVPGWIQLPKLQACLGGFADSLMLSPRPPGLQGFSDLAAWSVPSPPGTKAHAAPELRSPSASSISHGEAVESEGAKSDRELHDVSVSTDCSQQAHREEYEAALEEIDALHAENLALRMAMAEREVQDVSGDCTGGSYKDELEAANRQIEALRAENHVLCEASRPAVTRDAATECSESDCRGECEVARSEVEALRAEVEALREARGGPVMVDAATECSQQDVRKEYEAARLEIEALRAEVRVLQEARAAPASRDASTECNQRDYREEYGAARAEIEALRAEVQACREASSERAVQGAATRCDHEEDGAHDEVGAFRAENLALREEVRELRERLAELLGMRPGGEQQVAAAASSGGSVGAAASAPTTPLRFPTGLRFAPEVPSAPGELARVLARRRREVDSRATHYSNDDSSGKAAPQLVRRSRTMPTWELSAQDAAAAIELEERAPAVDGAEGR
mmetsp:Transcript_38695/g.111836  ORF Transcript_38695/g.111836 Transcript_38695/m.111836 type:complete len:592 (-) Transcript_38695:53-1828(-)